MTPTSLRRTNNKEKTRTLEHKLRHLVSDLAKGDYDRHEKTNMPGTGRPWVQTQRIRIDGIDGYALVDAFDFINQRFVPLTPRDVVSAVHNHRGFFASTASLRDGDYDPVFLTHHVTDYDPLDRLRADVAGRFDLGLIMTWQGEEIHREVLPFCRVDEEIQKAIDGGFDLLAVRIGTEKDFRRVAQFGMRLDKSNAYALGLSAKADPQYLQTLLQNSVGEMLPELFDGNIQWDVDTPAGVELPTDMSRISDDSDMEDDEPVQIASEGSPMLFDMEPEREIAETDEATAHVEVVVTS